LVFGAISILAPGLKERSDAGAGDPILRRVFGPQHIDREKRHGSYAKQTSRGILLHDQAQQAKDKQKCAECSQHNRLLES
jgi:hypothetical protein